MGTVGIIANPASGKDIRRLVAYGTVFDNQEKVNIVRCLILGLAAKGVKKIMYMPEYYGIVPRAVETLSSQHRPDVEFVPADLCVTASQQDTVLATAEMVRNKVACIVTLGGDGTNRLVAKECKQVPLLPISTGTNNVFPTMIEGTIAGLAAGTVAQAIVTGPPAINPTKMLVIYKNGIPVDIALVDAVVLKDNFIGSRAVWDTERIRQIVVTRGEAHNIGISSIIGNLAPTTIFNHWGWSIEIGAGNIQIQAPIAPGLVELVPIKAYHKITIDEIVQVIHSPCVIALDGEREVEVKEDDQAEIKLTFGGPLMINAVMALQESVTKKVKGGKIKNGC